MVKSTVHRLLKRRHFWREADFDELSEIYISMMFRGLSISMSAIFIPIYLLKLDYSVVHVLMFFACYFGFRAIFFDFFAGYLVSKFGPKHTILLSYIVSIVSTAQFLTLPSVHWPIWLLGAVGGAASSIFWIPFHVNFSMIKHKAHGGKELAYVNIMTKLGGVVGPLLGGLVATLFGGQYIFVVATIVLLMGSVPLMITAESVSVSQRLDFSLLRLHRIRRDLISCMAFGVEQITSNLLWPLYLGAYVLVSKAAYAKLGMLASVSVLAAMLSAYTIGKVVDKHHGRRLLRAGTIINACLHMVRPFVATYPAALAVNMANEGVSVAYQLPYNKGMYDAADDLPQHRISYFVAMETLSSFARAGLWVVLILLTLLFAEQSVIRAGFLIGAVASLLIMTEKFKALGTK